MPILVVFLPLFGAIIAGALALFGAMGGEERTRRFKAPAQWITCGAMLASAALAVLVFVDVALRGNVGAIHLFTWIASGAMEVSWSLKLDTLSAVMMAVVSVVSALIHVYSVGYMADDPGVPRFMAYLNLFTFFMLMLVTADNLLQLFFGWEGVGLASYLLIGFWYDRPSANAAAIKAFVVNRIGDFGFLLGILGTFVLFQSINLDVIFAAAPAEADTMVSVFGGQYHALTVISLLLFIGAMGKSAQLGLHTWLPDAMEGPTPVSALIHAATMVTAGVFLVARFSPFFEHSALALGVVTFIGASTAIFAATVACTQTDIKRVIAYSTCSQLGYMFFACGVSAYSAGIFHLMTHAFFKALLFLGAGAVIHALSGEQDMRRMGGLWKRIPVTYGLMWIGSLALAGIWPFAGFYSKDIILESAYAAHTGIGQYAFWMGALAAFLTAFYSWRLLILTFHGAPRADHHTMAHVHESPLVMLIPIGGLAVGALVAGFAGYNAFVGDDWRQFWAGSIFVLPWHTTLEDAHHVPTWVVLSPLIAGVAGIALAVLMYAIKPDLPGVLATRFRAIYLFLLNKWYFDELYDAVFVRPSFRIGRGLWKGGDGFVIDGFGPDGIAAVTSDLARRTRRLQTGYVYHYAFAMLIGLVIIITTYLFYWNR
jgi:NADH-quinone oxidoreductase subunit L